MLIKPHVRAGRDAATKEANRCDDNDLCKGALQIPNHTPSRGLFDTRMSVRSIRLCTTDSVANL